MRKFHVIAGPDATPAYPIVRKTSRLMPRLDRLARSTRDLLNTLAAITGKDYAEEALSVVHSLNLRSALGIFFQSRPKFGGGFESPFVRLEDGTRPMRR